MQRGAASVPILPCRRHACSATLHSAHPVRLCFLNACLYGTTVSGLAGAVQADVCGGDNWQEGWLGCLDAEQSDWQNPERRGSVREALGQPAARKVQRCWGGMRMCESRPWYYNLLPLVTEVRVQGRHCFQK